MEMLTAQITLEPAKLKALTDESRRRQISIDELVSKFLSRSLDDYLMPEKQQPPDPMSIIGLGESGLEDVSEKHDFYLGEIIANEHLR